MFGYNDQTLADFRTWLRQRYDGLGKLNAALGTHPASEAEIVPPGAEEMAQIGTDDPRRALWAEWIEFRFQLMERMHRRDYEAIRTVSRKPIFDRTAGDGMNWCGVPASGALEAARQDRRSRWHDALGSHVISPFLLDYQVGMSRGKRIVQSEYYWSTYGGSSDGVRYRLGGNLMHPVLQNDARNFAAVGRNLWKAVSRGNDLFTVYFANPVNTYGQFDEGYWGPHTAYWGDHSFKGMTYAMKVVPREINRFRGELIGARHVPQVGLLEPLASIVHTIGTPGRRRHPRPAVRGGEPAQAAPGLARADGDRGRVAAAGRRAPGGPRRAGRGRDAAGTTAGTGGAVRPLPESGDAGSADRVDRARRDAHRHGAGGALR